MANAFTESQPVFLDRIKLAGVPDAAKDRLLASGVDTVAKFAFAAGQPGETPSDDKLNALVRVADEDIPVATTAALRRLAFESQTLMIAQVKALVENKSEDQRSELAPAERAERLRQQGIRLAGISRRGESECSYQSYDLVMKMIQDNTITYLSPSKFGSRHEELKMDKPRKELDVVSGTVQVKDKHQEVLCSPHTPLLLHHALQRRALAMDLVGAATFDIVQEYHEFLLSHLSMDPPPGYRRIDVSQVLEADRTGWLRLAEKLPTGLRRNAAGVLPLDEELPKLQGDPRVVFHLMPLPVGGAIKRNTEDNSDGGPRKQIRGRGRGKGNGKGKQVRQPSSMPVELKGKWSTTRSFAGLGDRFAEAFHCHLFQRGARSFAEAAEHEEAAYKSKAKEMLKSGIEGLGLTAGFYEYCLDDLAAILITCILGALVLGVVFGVPGGILLQEAGSISGRTRDVGVQASLGMARDEQRYHGRVRWTLY
ncbi:hypothetical protein AK812_SmicGene43609 [Symbiodinium microadriaticum]|uniref:Uncharacterized protein n=1 Tax=Symbiodinium microadriaticum TaxID=2951 RepID=A0A1Q9C0L7_SYMMI|nr:hypothetical protein AK812_SmicGene43609 [Symbiodinium microadriaticum]